MLEDGTYESLVFDAADTGAGELVVELTIIAGSHKGEVVSVRSNTWSGDPIELLGIPAQLRVVDGTPTVRFEP